MSKRPEPTREQLQAALERLAAAAPHVWKSTDLAQLSPLRLNVVRARALQAANEADLRARRQERVLCTTPDGRHFTRRVYGGLTDQLALDKELT